jgi:glycine/D-amino acid oxidase-like deaminating enzyme
MHAPPSLWWSQIDATSSRAPLGGDIDVDVAIVGGGYTGLWTARELLRRDPRLRVAVLEAQVCGFGASGRNGGWASALFPVAASTMVKDYGREDYTRQRRYLQDAVTSLGQAARDDGIECDFAPGGTLTFARSEVQEARARRDVNDAADLGVTSDDVRWVGADELAYFGRVNGARGAVFSPHCARLHPARLARGLADAVEHLGGSLYEHSRVTRIIPGTTTRRARVLSSQGTVTADYVVRATEGFTPTFARARRSVVPLYSLMIATAPLPASFWQHYGFAQSPTFSDERHLLVYGQRTADDRLAFGGRGSPYHFGSTVEPRYDTNEAVFHKLAQSLKELFPALDAPITHRWGGPLAMPRSGYPYVDVDHARGIAAAGGYTGDGVTLSYVCATALADMIIDPDTATPASTLPFVQRPLRRWEVEPLRWLGINTGIALATYADYRERTTDRESRASKLLARLTRR